MKWLFLAKKLNLRKANYHGPGKIYCYGGTLFFGFHHPQSIARLAVDDVIWHIKGIATKISLATFENSCSRHIVDLEIFLIFIYFTATLRFYTHLLVILTFVYIRITVCQERHFAECATTRMKDQLGETAGDG